MELDFVINHGNVVLPAPHSVFSLGSRPLIIEPLHIGIKNGKIASLSSTPLTGAITIDARHLHVLPGVIDSQVHFREPGLTHKEDLESGTASAAAGGVTSVFEMPNTQPPTTSQRLLQEKMRLAEGRAWVNYAFYGGGSLDNFDQIAPMEATPGCCGIKIFMGSSFGNLLVKNDEDLESILSRCHRRVAIHAEDEVRLQERKNIFQLNHDVTKHHEWRDPQTAFKATERLLKIAKKLNKKVHILHVSTREEVDVLSRHKDLASFEVTPNHLTFVAPDCYKNLGSLVQMNPPIREIQHQEALWAAIHAGLVDVIGTDHAPHTLDEKAQKYPQSPSGIPGVQTLVPVMLTHVHQKRLSLEKFVELVGENPRRLFGCLSKGRIALGLDADFTIVDLKQGRTIENSWIRSRCGWTPFHGTKATGWPIYTIVAGKMVMSQDELQEPACGRKILFS